MAIKGLNGFGWLATFLIVAPGCYLVSSQVASERARVEGLERAIMTARKDIRELETEFDTRANLAQLERWNGEVMRYTAPTPAQFLPGDAALAQIRPLQGDGMAERYAAMVVPAGIPDVVTGKTDTATDVAAAVAPKPVAPKAAVVAAVTTAAPRAETIAAAVSKPVRVAAVKARDEAVAALDSKLLKDSSFGDLMKGVRAEAKRVR